MKESGEMYLETILVLTEKNENVRSIDVCEEMGFSKPSISRAMSLLKNAGMIGIDEKGRITLTDQGQKEARRIYERHRVLTEALCRLGVSPATAAEDACKIEHDISDETLEAIRKSLEK